MKNTLTFATLLLSAVVLSTNVSAQFPQGAQLSPEQMKAAQEQAMKMLKPAVEEAFDSSDVDDSDSLDKDEMLEFGIEMVKASTKLMAQQGMPVQELSEADESQLREMGKQEVDERFKEADTDESGDITQDEILKIMFGDAYSGEEEVEEEEEVSESTSDEGENGSDDSEEPSAEAY